MKKIISLISAIAVMATVSTSAFAAIEATPLDKGLSKGTAPKATLSIVRDESVEVDANGYYTYNLQVDLSDLGTIGSCVLDPEDPPTFGGVKMYYLEYSIETDQDIELVSGKGKLSGPDGTTGLTIRLASTANGDTYDKGLYCVYSQTSDDLHQGYPKTNDSLTIDTVSTTTSLTKAFYRVIKAKPGTTFTVVDAGSTVSYKVYGMDENYATVLDPSQTANGVPLTSTVASITLPAVGQPAPETYPIEMTVTEKVNVTNANGYIWALAFGANKDKLASLTATFEDGEREAFVANIPAAAVTAVTGGTTTINVGLKTGATLTGATFVAGNSDVNTEATTQVLYK